MWSTGLWLAVFPQSACSTWYICRCFLHCEMPVLGNTFSLLTSFITVRKEPPRPTLSTCVPAFKNCILVHLDVFYQKYNINACTYIIILPKYHRAHVPLSRWSSANHPRQKSCQKMQKSCQISARISNILWFLRNILWFLRNILWFLRNILWFLRNILWDQRNILWDQSPKQSNIV